MNASDAQVFLVDGDRQSHAHVRPLAAMTGARCETFTSAERFLDKDTSRCVGCVITELRLPGLSGLELLERLAAEDSVLPVVFHGRNIRIAEAVGVMKAGALTVLEKPARPDELLSAIRFALELSATRHARRTKRQTFRQRLSSLTGLERKIWDLVMTGNTNRRIARDLAISRSAVDRLRQTILKKMDAESTAEMARTVAECQVFDEAGNPTCTLSDGQEPACSG